MTKIWKKEDFKCKYIYVTNKEENNKVIKFLENLGFISREGWDKNYNFNNCNYIHFSLDENNYQYHNHTSSSTQINIEDIFPIQEEQKSLRIVDMVKYEYYYTKEIIGDFWMLYRYKQIHDSNLDTVDYTCHINSNKEFCKDDHCFLFQRTTRKATPEEIKWLELCSEKGKFIEYNKIVEYTNKEEDLLEIAKAKYPIGTKVKSVQGSIGIINSYYEKKYGVYANEGQLELCLKEPRKWAEIISSPIEQSSTSIPQFVRLTNKVRWSVDGEYTGEIFKISDLSNLSKFNSGGTKETFREDINKWIKGNHFEICDEYAYNLQQNPIKIYESPKTEIINSYCMGVDPYLDTKIEVGDEVELLKGIEFAGCKIGDRTTVLQVNQYDIVLKHRLTGYPQSGGTNNGEYWKITRKANKNNTIQTNNKEQVITSLPKTGSEFNIQMKSEPKELTFEGKVKKTGDFNIKLKKNSKQLTF